jgi:ABC-type antimicrobial peptide transport system permease subunit
MEWQYSAVAILLYIVGFVLGAFVGFMASFVVLALIDKMPDLKNYLLDDESSYLGLAVLVSFWTVLIGAVCGMAIVYFVSSSPELPLPAVRSSRD